MDVELITKLAIQAAEDPEACPVLSDALQEYGVRWGELVIRVHSLIYKFGPPIEGWWGANMHQPTCTFARALAAVLMFGEWSEVSWRPRYVVNYLGEERDVDELFGRGSSTSEAVKGMYRKSGGRLTISLRE